MQVKIQCPCGTRFSFDIEPVHGRMPVPVNCPSCGADGTALANAAIQEQLALTKGTPSTPAAPTPPIRLRVRKTETVQVPSDEGNKASDTPRCAKHPSEPAIETCRMCGKPMCAKCMELLGYVCSVYCRNQAESQGIELPVYKYQRAVMEERTFRRVKWVAAVCIGLVLALGAGWFWFAFYGSRPRVVYSETIPQDDNAAFYQLLAPHDLLSIRQGKMTLYDVAQKRRLWSTALNLDSSSSAAAATPDSNSTGPISSQSRTEAANHADNSTSGGSAGTEEIAGPMPKVVVTTNAIWLLSPNQIVQYNRDTGRQKQRIPLESAVVKVSPNHRAIVAVSANGPSGRKITRIALPSGTVQTEQLGMGSNGGANGRTNTTRLARALARNAQAAPGMRGAPVAEASASARGMGHLFADNAGAIRVWIHLVQSKFITREAMKPRKKSLLNNSLTAADSMEASVQEMNDVRHQEGKDKVKEDVSRYQVTLQLLGVSNAPAWTGPVIGPPDFFPLTTVNVLAGGKSIIVFDKNCQKLWQAELTYFLPKQSAHEAGGQTRPIACPCLEAGNSLYVFDRGMLTAFEATTGKVRWRLTSVGISSVKTGPRGNLYVVSTTASADMLEFAREINLRGPIEPVIMKVDPATGKVLWRTKGIADQCYPGERYLYAARSSTDPLAVLNNSKHPKVFYHLFRLNPSNGQTEWDYFQPQWPQKCETCGKWILLRFPENLQVLTFRTL